MGPDVAVSRHSGGRREAIASVSPPGDHPAAVGVPVGDELEEEVREYVRSAGFIPTGHVTFRVAETESAGKTIVATVPIRDSWEREGS